MRLLKSVLTRRMALVAVSAVLIGGCLDLSSPSQQLGHMLVQVKDDAGVGVSGLQVDLMLPDRATVWASLRTSADGSGEFRADDGGVLPQSYILRIMLTGTPYELSADDTNDKAVIVQPEQRVTANFTVVKRVVGGP